MQKQKGMPTKAAWQKTTHFKNPRWRTAAILKIVISPYLCEQEAQLSQRDRALLGIIEYFAKSLKIILNGILEKGVNPY